MTTSCLRALFCLNAIISWNADQHLVTFNHIDLQMELFQIDVTFFTQIDHPKWLPLPLIKIAKIENRQYLMNFRMDFAKICVILMLSLRS